VLLVKLQKPFAPSLSNELCQSHIHNLKHQVQPPVLKFNFLGSHNVRTVPPTIPFLVLVEPLEDLDFSLVEGFLLGLVLILEFLNSILLASLHVSALVNMAKTARAYHIPELIFVP